MKNLENYNLNSVEENGLWDPNIYCSYKQVYYLWYFNHNKKTGKILRFQEADFSLGFRLNFF